MFNEEPKCLLPANAKSPITLKKYLYLSEDRGFVVYKIKNEYRTSIISINLDRNTYTFIGESYHIDEEDYYIGEFWGGELSLLSDNTISVLVHGDYWEYSTINLFKIDEILSTCEFQRGILIPEYGKWLTMINGKLVYALFETIDQLYDEMRVDAIMIREEDGTLKRLENTGVHLSKASFRYDPSFLSFIKMLKSDLDIKRIFLFFNRNYGFK